MVGDARDERFPRRVLRPAPEPAGPVPPGAIAEALGVSASLVTSEAAEEMRVAYHRRPLVGPDRVAALALASTAIGSSWPGSYPTRTEHVGKLRIQQLFRQTYGAHLAELPAILPEPGDDLRWVARADAERGYLFVSNQRGPRDVQFEVQFAERRIALPAVKSAPAAVSPGRCASASTTSRPSRSRPSRSPNSRSPTRPTSCSRPRPASTSNCSSKVSMPTGCCTLTWSRPKAA